MYRGYKGRFKPKNWQKYKGDPTNIIYRSLLERQFMVYLDTHSGVLEWQSEEIQIKYISPVDNRVHTYYPDFFVKYITKENKIEETLIEIKPESQTVEPKVKKKKTRQYLTEVATWLVNNAKWNAAKSYCNQRGIVFKIITEKDIRGKKK
jgi:hypothetical protein